MGVKVNIFAEETTLPFTDQEYVEPMLLTTVGFKGSESPIATLNPLEGIAREIKGVVTLFPLLHDENKVRPAKKEKITQDLIFNILKIKLMSDNN